MNAMRALRDKSRLVTVLGFAFFCLLGFGYLWVNAGGTIPVISEPSSYRVTFVADDVKSLRDLGDVKIAGVEVGRVESRELQGDGGVRIEMSLDDEYAPLHKGATVRVGIKSLVGSSYVEIVDGDGAEISDGTKLPAESVIPAVDVDELFDTLDAPTRQSLSKAVQALEVATEGRGQDLDATMTGLGLIANQGGTALDALAAQSEDLQALTVETRDLLDALDIGRGQIADLVRNARTLTGATAAKQDKLEQTVRALPGLIRTLDPAAADLNRLGVTLAPIAADLRRAAPDLNLALVNLPAVTNDLNGLLPSLDGTLDQAPATLDRIPDFDASLRSLIPATDTMLRDVNPMLAYLSPYGHDLGALFANFGGSFDGLAEDGIRPIRLTATAEGLATIRQNPIDMSDLNPLSWTNPYPAPGTAGDVGPRRWSGTYPQVQADPR